MTRGIDIVLRPRYLPLLAGWRMVATCRYDEGPAFDPNRIIVSPALDDLYIEQIWFGNEPIMAFDVPSVPADAFTPSSPSTGVTYGRIEPGMLVSVALFNRSERPIRSIAVHMLGPSVPIVRTKKEGVVRRERRASSPRPKEHHPFLDEAELNKFGEAIGLDELVEDWKRGKR